MLFDLNDRFIHAGGSSYNLHIRTIQLQKLLHGIQSAGLIINQQAGEFWQCHNATEFSCKNNFTLVPVSFPPFKVDLSSIVILLCKLYFSFSTWMRSFTFAIPIGL